MTARPSQVAGHRGVRRRVIRAPAIATLLLAIALGVVLNRSAAPAAGRSAPPPAGPVGFGAADPVPTTAAVLPAPHRLRIPAIGVDSPLESLTLDPSGALSTPRNFGRAGWFTGGPAPGDIGPAVIAGHVDSERGAAVFYRLRELRPGDLVEVARGERWVAFRVIATERHPKSRFPTHKVYGPTPVPELRLITCGGSFDHARRSYHDNIVVYAIAAA